VNARPNDLPAECTFHRNGSSSWIVGYIGLPLTTGHGWFVRGNELILTDVPHLAWRLDLRSVQRNLKVLFNRLKDDGVVERFEILEISESTLKLKRSHPWGNSPDGVETYLKQQDHERQGQSNRNESGSP
jgi:hypothetical protein